MISTTGASAAWYRTADRGDKVQVWFEAKDGTKSEAFTYSLRRDTGNPVLVVANEDYTGLSPVQTGGSNALKYYTAALRANNIKYDLYDVDANGRKAPDPVGVLKHYKLVIWETGSDIITRESGQLPGTASKLANDMMLAMRAYLNDGGKLIYAGKYAGLQYSANGYIFDPVNNAPCDPETEAPGCVALSDDFLQYYLGAYIYNDGAGIDVDGNVQPVAGLATPFKGFEWAFTPQDHLRADPYGLVHCHQRSPTGGAVPAIPKPRWCQLRPPERCALRAVRRRAVRDLAAGRPELQASYPYDRPKWCDLRFARFLHLA